MNRRSGWSGRLRTSTAAGVAAGRPQRRQPAPGVLRRNHPSTPVYGMPISRRLAGRAVRVVRLFYPDLPFGPAVLPGVRKLRLRRAAVAAPRQRRLDSVVDLAAREGWAHVELPR